MMRTLPHDFVNVKIKDRFHKDYKLTKGEIKFAFFSAIILFVEGLGGLIYWMILIATR